MKGEIMNKLVTVDSKENSEFLRKKCLEIIDINDDIKQLAEDMLNQLTPLKAIGLAAPQFGVSVQLFVLRLRGIELAMVNPVIDKEKGSHVVAESCLSIPGKFYKVKRPKKVKVSGLGLNYVPITFTGHNLLAQAICHEVDHLKGILICDIAMGRK